MNTGHNAIKIEAAWRKPLVAASLLFLLLFLIYRDTAMAMFSIWNRAETYAHGFVVPVISAWLIWRRRAQLATLLPSPSLSAICVMAASAALWLMGDLVAVNAATQFAFVAMLVLIVPIVLGWRVAMALTFPLTFLFFAVPIGDFMMPRLMEWTADFTVLAVRATGIPVYREGQQFVIPSGNWSVVEACSGIRYLIASVTVGSLFAYLSYRSTQRRVIFVVVSFLVPIVANWLRAYIIVLLGHYSGNKIATGVDHLIYGWVFFGIVIMIMFMIGARWAESDDAVSTTGVDPATSNHPGAAEAASQSLYRLALSTGLAVVVMVAPHVINWELSKLQNAELPVLAAVSAQAGWKRTDSPPTDWKPVFENPVAQSHTSFVDGRGATVGLYIAYYRQQDYARKLVSSSNVLVTTKDPLWARVSATGVDALILKDQIQVESSELRRLVPAENGTEQRLLVWQYYWIQGRLTSSDYWAKIYGALTKLMGRGDDGAVVMVYTFKSKAGDPIGADATLQSFLDKHAIEIERTLQATRNHLTP